MITDFRVQDRVTSNGKQFDTEFTSRIQEMLSKPRHLDGAPDKYKPVDLSEIDQQPFGTYMVFGNLYTSLYNETEPKDGILKLKGEDVQCSYKVLCALKALTLSGVTKSTEKARACRDLFGIILGCRADGKLTEDNLWSAFKEHGDFYMNELSRANVDCIYSEEEKMQWELKRQMKGNYDIDALSCFEVANVDDLKSAILSIYKEACADQSFTVIRKDGRATNAVRYIRSKK